MGKLFGALLAGMFTVGQAHAALSIECGDDVDAGNMTVGKPVLMIGSTSDNFVGSASDKAGGWTMKYRGEEYPPHQAIGSEKRVAHGEVLSQIEITIQVATAPSGPVGKRLVIENPYDDIPLLVEYNLGGFTGPIKLKDYACVSTQD